MLAAGLNGLAFIHWSFLELWVIVSRSAMGMLGTMLELVVFFALVWALLGSRSVTGKARQDERSQRLRARQKELTLK
jgi:hypothetical protein